MKRRMEGISASATGEVFDMDAVVAILSVHRNGRRHPDRDDARELFESPQNLLLRPHRLLEIRDLGLRNAYLETEDVVGKTGDFARHTRGGESRERLREAFDTPLYPMILIANEVMREGLEPSQALSYKSSSGSVESTAWDR